MMMCVAPSEWFIVGLPSWGQEVQFPGIILEFQEYYNEKCTSHSRHYCYCT